MIELLKQMVEALEWSEGLGYELQGHKEAIQAGLKAIAELESQEPVAWMYVNTDGECEQIEYGEPFDDPSTTPLYTHPPQRTWVGLMRGVRVEGNAVVITVKGGNDEARALCGELINEMEKNT